MKAVIFAAGLGTRLRPLTDRVPKPMIEIGGKPILSRTLEALPDAVSEAVVVIGYKGEIIRSYFETRSDVLPIRFVEQPELRGTYDALRRARPYLADDFLALNGDDLYAKADLERLSAAEPFAMLGRRVPAPNPYSHLEIVEARLSRIMLNKDSVHLKERLVYVGACRLDVRFFDLEPAQTPSGELGLPHTLERHLNAYPVRVLEASSWMPIGTPEELRAACAALETPRQTETVREGFFGRRP